MTNIVYNGKTYTDDVIISVNCHESNAMIEDTLEIDTLDVEILSKSAAGFLPFEYGTEVAYYLDDTLIGKFRLESVKRTRKNVYALSCVSFVGILDRVRHYGGVYTGVLLGNLLRDILGTAGLVEGRDYEIEQAVGQGVVSGWLPVASCRDNLRQCLFQGGVSLMKDTEGVLHFVYNLPNTYETIPEERTYMGGSLEQPSFATKIVVLEHEYKKTNLDKEVTLYDGADANNKIILFSNPCYDLEWNGSTFSGEHGANYAIVNGTGVLTGKEYSHTTHEKVVEKSEQYLANSEGERYLTSDGKHLTFAYDGEPNEVSVKDCTLVSLLNSENVAERVANYYNSANIVGASFVLEGEKPMDRVRITDVYGKTKLGYIKSIDMNGSGIIKADAEIVSSWKPSHVGNTFNYYKIFRRSDVVGGK